MTDDEIKPKITEDQRIPYLKKSRKRGVVVLLKHTIGSVQLLDVGVVGVEVRGKGCITLITAVVVIGLGVVTATLKGETK